MDMADFRKEVVFDLEIQASQVPGRKWVIRGKICGCFDLMNGPLILHDSGIGVRFGEVIAFNRVGQLKNQGNRKSDYEMNCEEDGQNLQRGVEQQGDNQYICKEDQFPKKEAPDLRLSRFLEFVFTDAPGEVLPKVRKHP